MSTDKNYDTPLNLIFDGEKEIKAMGSRLGGNKTPLPAGSRSGFFQIEGLGKAPYHASHEDDGGGWEVHLPMYKYAEIAGYLVPDEVEPEGVKPLAEKELSQPTHYQKHKHLMANATQRALNAMTYICADLGESGKKTGQPGASVMRYKMIKTVRDGGYQDLAKLFRGWADQLDRIIEDEGRDGREYFVQVQRQKEQQRMARRLKR